MLVQFNLRQFRGPWRWAAGEPPLEVFPPPPKNDSLVMFLAVCGNESEDLWREKKRSSHVTRVKLPFFKVCIDGTQF